MKKNQARQAQPKIKRVPIKKKPTSFVLVLYVAGDSVNSRNAVANIKKICKENLLECYVLDIIDLYQQPQLAKDEQIFLLPTLVKKLPAPLRRIIGDLTDTDKVLVALDIKKKV